MSIISAPVPGRNRTLSGFLVSLTEGVPFIGDAANLLI
ncbi:response regulator [Escherichia coli P0299438.10]|nr:response regulator [Escherichia coli 201600.1]ENB88567.1 response regulator [Escherichia coli P0299438.10]ENC04993.1 response regulator [Escherichia coli P0299438.4]PDN98286.1 response regulator [Escherichia coli]